MTFKELHYQSQPLLLCNVWDAASARVAEKLGFAAIGTSSAAMASMLGYEDGERMPFSQLRFLVERIMASTTLPLTVDLEAGYGRDIDSIVKNVNTVAKLGVAGINIEDSVVKHERLLADPEILGNTVREIKRCLEQEGLDLFVNVRTDVFLLGTDNPVVEAQERIHTYAQAGADGFFVPCVTELNDIRAVVGCTHLPINVMCMPELADFDTLAQIGVKRISMGNFVFDYLAQHNANTLTAINECRSFSPLFQCA